MPFSSAPPRTYGTPMYLEISRIIRLFSSGAMAVFFSFRKFRAPDLMLSTSCVGTGLSSSFFSSSASFDENRGAFAGFVEVLLSFLDFDANRGDEPPHPSHIKIKHPAINAMQYGLQKSPVVRGLCRHSLSSLSKIRPQRFASRRVPQPTNGLFLNLSYAFARQVEFLADLF